MLIFDLNASIHEKNIAEVRMARTITSVMIGAGVGEPFWGISENVQAVCAP